MNQGRPRNAMAAEEQQAKALTKAAIDSARQLGLSPVDTSAALGVPLGVFNAMKKGERVVDGYNGEAECADALVRIVKRLNLLFGADESKWRAWMRREVASLAAKPLDVLTQKQGVLKVALVVEATSTTSAF